MSLKKINQVKSDRGFKIWDLLVYGVILAAAAALLIAVFVRRDNNPLKGIIITVGEETALTYDFETGIAEYTDVEQGGMIEVEQQTESLFVFSVRRGKHYNRVRIDKSARTVKVIAADCSRNDCVYTSAIKDNSGMIYCSPNDMKIMPYDYHESPDIII